MRHEDDHLIISVGLAHLDEVFDDDVDEALRDSKSKVLVVLNLVGEVEQCLAIPVLVE